MERTVGPESPETKSGESILAAMQFGLDSKELDGYIA